MNVVAWSGKGWIVGVCNLVSFGLAWAVTNLVLHLDARSHVAVLFGLWLWLGYGIGRGPGNGWLHAKLLLVLLVIFYHYFCARLLRQFEVNRNTRSHVWFRWFNEIPVILLLLVVVLVVVKPF